ncbi:TPA: Ldh family oxidoreductase [Candidatus Poribacteria bacterium]|nr:Ldh family oxidoreductase [Candidatus Poribacteria bacterium]
MPPIQAQKLKQIAISYLERSGIPSDHALIIADVLVEAELRGKSTHGVIRLEGIRSRYQRVQRSEIKVVRRLANHILIDGGNNPGYVVGYLAAQRAIGLARRNGSAMVGAFNTTHCGMLGYYTDMIRREDMIGIATCNCYPRVTPFGGVEPIFGTNPLSVAIPTKDEDPPLLFDASLASITNGQLMLMGEKGGRIPPGLAFDERGDPTDDPKKALSGAVRPFGGHKGYGLMFISQILTTALLGATLTPPIGREYGFLIMAINPEIFIPIDRFKEEVSRLIERIKSVRREPGVGEILLPGERSWRLRCKRLKEGIDLDERLIERIKEDR